MKTCKKCSSVDLNNKGKCKACARTRAKAWRIKNPGKDKANCAEWRAKNTERQKTYGAEWRAANSEHLKARGLAYRALNPGIDAAKTAAWAKKNPELAKARLDKWRSANPEAMRIHGQNRRARERLVNGKLSKNLSAQLFKLQNGKCACCNISLGRDYHLDHIMPISLGGGNEDRNMQLLRKTCNLKKHAKHPIDFMQAKGFLL